MCGIFGFAAWDRDLPRVDHLCRATNLLRHRGPDGGGYWREPGVFFGHRRLAIIDLNTGDQPMASADGRYVITFNGEIYNYPELRDELRALGARFLTASDTEVILAAFAAWGTEMLPRFEGMFAFALYDRVTRTLLLARDRFGEKPLLYAESNGRVAFASELAPLAALGLGGRELDPEALAGYLCLNYVPGSATLLRSIRRLGPAEWRLYGAEGLRDRGRYWSPAAIHPSERHRSRDSLLDELQERLDRAVRMTLRSDVPVGLFLSGGIDSSVVAESAVRAGRLDAAFCLDMQTQGFSEWTGASTVARQLDVELERVPMDGSVLAEFLDITGHLDDPLADSSAMAVWTVSRATARRVKVVLSGDGGDELFGGYLTYLASRWHRVIHPLLPEIAREFGARAGVGLGVDDRVKVGAAYKLQRFLRALALPTREAHFTWNGTWLPADASALVTNEACRRALDGVLKRLATSCGIGETATLHELQAGDIGEYLPNDILTKVDRTTMAHGLESRAPLLNSDVAAFAMRLPERYRIGGGTLKVMLRALCARHFGRAHASAPKQGFSIPVHAWLREEGRPLMTALLQRDRIRALGVLDEERVAQAVQQHLAQERAYGWELWGLMVLVAWYDARVSAPPELRRLPPADDLRPMGASANDRTAEAATR
jgi:asparagine synthase (glutamine-hydrolysing)